MMLLQYPGGANGRESWEADKEGRQRRQIQSALGSWYQLWVPAWQLAGAVTQLHLVTARAGLIAGSFHWLALCSMSQIQGLKDLFVCLMISPGTVRSDNTEIASQQE